jgi:hypothetical protein
MPTPTSRPAAAADRLAYSARTRTGAAHNRRNAELQAARRAGAPAISDARQRSMAIGRQTTLDFNRDPVRRASDAAHAGARITLITGPEHGDRPQRRQTLVYSQIVGWVLDSSQHISPGVAYHTLRAADQIEIERG